jgi:UDP-glucose 4,6-dehydratase
MKNILVTGGCGFIASNFINYMVVKYPQFKFVNLDAMYYCANINNIIKEVATADNYKFIKGNLINSELIDFILQEHEIDTVVHFAAQSHVDNSFSNSLQYTKDNVLGTHTLLECCRVWGKITRFIHVSTDEVYGENIVGLDGKINIMNEKSILNPTNPYAATKASAEMIVNSYRYSYKMPIITTRGNNVYGPRQYPEKLIPKFMMLLLNGKKCTIHGKGATSRSFLYVDDVVAAFELILIKGTLGEIYNIGIEQEYSVMEITNKIINLVMPNLSEAEKQAKYIFVNDRDYNDDRYFISTEKLKSMGWKPKINIDEGLKKTLQYYVEKNIFMDTNKNN